MNRCYRTVYNRSLGLWQVVSELARGRARGDGSVALRSAPVSRGRFPLKRSLLAGSLGLLLGSVAQAADLPTGGQIVAGSGNIHQGGNNLTITQNSSKLIAHWQSFDIGAGHSVTFNQPSASAVALNRVLGNNGSEIYGQLNANGQVFLVNPNGILFAEGASVNVGGLVASTLDIRDEDFLAGNHVFTKHAANTAAVINRGNLTAADGGAIALLGGSVSNEGLIQARLGSVALASGNTITLDFAGDGLLSVTIDDGQLNALIENRGAIRADGGSVILTSHAADQLLNSVVNNSGIVQAQTMEEREGKIILLADLSSGTANIAGSLDASAPESGDGGFIETSGANVRIADGSRISTRSAQGETGSWLIDPQDFTIAASGGDISGATLSAQLADNHITVQSVNGATAGNGDIFVNDSIHWSQNTLTLSAERDIHINAEQHASGTAGLALEYNQADGGGDYFVNAPVNLASTGSFSTKDSPASSAIHYTIITELGAEGSSTGTDLQGISGNLSGNYVLGASIDASATVDWNAGAGFNPLGSSFEHAFMGSFNGLGHTIRNLTIHRPTTDLVGLFGFARNAFISNVGLVDNYVTGDNYVAGVAGNSYSSSITHSYVLGVVNGGSFVGGLVGYGYDSWLFHNYASGEIAGAHYVGGLVGVAEDVWLTQSYASGTVSGDEYVGGLVGASFRGSWFGRSWILDSYAVSTVSAMDYAGGLIGHNDQTYVENTWASGLVQAGGGNVGGLIGFYQGGSVVNSYWVREMTGQDDSAAGIGLDTLSDLQTTLPWGFGSNSWTNADNQSTPYLKSVSRNVGYLVTDPDTTHLYDIIMTVEQLQGIGDKQDGYYALGKDIDASATAAWNGGAGFSPIGTTYNPFLGVFDGLGFKINGLTINRPDRDLVGLFGHAGATIRNVGLEGGHIRGGEKVGSLVGFSSGTLTNVWATSTIIGTSGVGGLVGENTFGTITNAWSAGMVIAQNGSHVGGLVGINALGTINDVYSNSSVSGDYSVGGLLGMNMGSVTNVYATGPVNATYASGVSGLIGSSMGGFGVTSVTNAYWATDTTGQAASTGGGTGLTLAQLQSTLPMGFDTSVWANGNNGSTPYLKDLSINVGYLASDPGTTNQYHILGNIAAVQSITNNLSGHYALGRDIDASSTAAWNAGAGFSPISTDYEAGFTGVLDGLGHVIRGLTIYRPTSGDASLFGFVSSEGILRNVGLVDVDITGEVRVGGLASSSSGVISNAWVTGSVSGQMAVGGLVAGNLGTITHAWVDAAVSGVSLVGGLAGGNFGDISHAYAKGTVAGSNYIGGLVGQNTDGAVLGMGVGVIRYAYAMSAVSGDLYVGGLVGSNYEGGVIENAWAGGDVSFYASYAGGLVGENWGGRIENSYWDIFSTGQQDAAGDYQGEINNVSGIWLNAFEASSYAHLDDAAWYKVDGLRPLLKSEWSSTIRNAHQLQLMALNPSASYVLANDIDASETGYYDGMEARAWGWQGFQPIGNNTQYFSGILDGRGYSIHGLTIRLPDADFVGLFGYVAYGTVRNLGLVDAEISGRNRTGSLVGYLNAGTLNNVFADNLTLVAGDYTGGLVGISANGSIISETWATGMVIGQSFVGGLSGYAHSGSSINDSEADVVVSGHNQVGGLLGYSNGASLNRVQASGDVAAIGTYIGGLVGVLTVGGSVTDATASGSVSSSQHYVGGLVGYVHQGGEITNAAAEGGVSGLHRVGGLVGYNRGSLERVQAHGSVTATGTYIGGLVGVNAGSISQAWATGAVSTSQHYVGGLVGYSHTGSSITDARADGSVSGISRVGGLVGQHDGSLVNGLATGHITASYFNGGLIGHDGGGSVTASFWDTQSSGQLGSAIGGTGLGTASLQQIGTYTGEGWSIGSDPAGETVWLIEEGADYPQLRAFLPPL